MISACTKLHENESPSSEAEKEWIWKMISKNYMLSVFPYQIGARNETNNAAYFGSCPLYLRGTKPSVSWFNRRMAGNIAPCIIHHGTGWRWEVSCTPRQLSSCDKTPWYQFSKRLGWNFHRHNPSGRTVGLGSIQTLNEYQECFLGVKMSGA